ncbi:MAG TPA: M48 family metallopeptidase [Albitalea sp.]|uniref:M48 family metallopeptidase n=1 Tax=Piscinibacter sp. TaxID=1903157 RepID=UPI002ED506DB
MSAAPADTPWTRLALAVLAIAGIAAYHVVLIGPFALIMWLNPWAGYFGIWPVAAALAFIWWTLQPWHETPGVRLAPADAPVLFEDLRVLATQLGAPPIHELRLTGDFNAAAIEAPVRWQPWRKRRVLVLGVPLLALAGTSTVRAVIAHELGHFSHRHGRLGQWIYRARLGWLSYAASTIESVGLLERGAAYFAGWFAPRFSALSFTYSRRCEYEADAFGAAVVGPVGMASALLTIDAVGDRWRAMADRELPRLVREQIAPPASWLAHVRQQVLTQPPQAQEWERLRARGSTPDDTHPSLAERLSALAVSGEQALGAASLPAQVAGAAWIVRWDEVVADCDTQWRRAQERIWRQEHIRQRAQVERLEALRGAQDLGLERARLELDHGDAGTAAELARRWNDHPSLSGEAAFVLGAAQLRVDDPAGIEALEACIAAEPAWAAPARELIERHAAMLAGDTARRRNHALLQRARRRRARALGEVHRLMSFGELAPATVPLLALEILRAVLSGMPAVAAAWCAGLDELVHEERRYRAVVLILRLHTGRLQEAGLSEDDFLADARLLLSQCLPAATLRLVWTVYTTEPFTPELDARLAAWARAGDPACLVAPREGEGVGPGLRASALG